MKDGLLRFRTLAASQLAVLAALVTSMTALLPRCAPQPTTTSPASSSSARGRAARSSSRAATGLEASGRARSARSATSSTKTGPGPRAGLESGWGERARGRWPRDCWCIEWVRAGASAPARERTVACLAIGPTAAAWAIAMRVQWAACAPV